VADFRVAVVGSGPSGFYAAEALLRSGLSLAVDMFERLPVPYGLVRFGVAPDHPKLKQVTTVFDRIAAMPGFRFAGGVEVGTDVAVETLRACYHAVILATGADVGRRLNIPGEALAGCHQAGDFVAWYNGHPHFRERKFDLSGERAVVVGHGNVALDVARILVKSADELRHTDIASHALEVLAESRIREVQIVGRRGLSETRFAARELEEFLGLSDCDPAIEPGDFPDGCHEIAADAGGEVSEAGAIIARFASRPNSKRKRCMFRFGLAPHGVEGGGRVERMLFRRGGTSRDARNTCVALDCNLVLASIGRVAAPLASIPYSEGRGVHANVAGRVVADGSPVRGLYVCGWGKRGASGTIGTNRACSVETVEALIEDLKDTKEALPGDADTLLDRLSRELAGYVDYSGWRRINEAEIACGRDLGKPRHKLVSTEHMNAVARGGLGDGSGNSGTRGLNGDMAGEPATSLAR